MPDSMDFSRKPVLVLGASGFIGSRVVAALAGSPLYRAVAASRRSVLSLDATDTASIRAALQDIDYVVNCISGNDRVMVRSTEALCDAARMVPPRRIIHLSSMAVYGAAKIACERIVRKYVADGGDAVILRPTCVFGPGSPQWTTRLANLLRVGRIGDLGTAGDGSCNLAFIDDVVAGIIAALDAPDISGQAYNISSSSGLTWNSFLMAFGKALGATPVRRISSRTMRIETKLLAPARRIAGMAIRSSMTEAITPSLAALWRQDIRIDTTAARRALALPQTTPDRMIAAVLQSERTQEAALS
jgi:nucleoside-diphosphate-sugar epimerase